MRYYAEFRHVVQTAEAEAVETAAEHQFLRAIATTRDWAESRGEEFDALVEAMAQQLPDGDIDRFLESVRYGFRSRTLDAGLTGSIVVQPLGGQGHQKVVFVRVRAYIEDAQKEAELPGIGLEIANTLLQALPRMELTAMMIWQDRGHNPVLIGGVREGRSLLDTIRGNKVAALLSAVAGGLLVVLWFLALVTDGSEGLTRTQYLESDAVDWFKRLVGPLSSTLVGSSVALLVLFGQGRGRSAYWLLGDDHRGSSGP